MKQQVIITPCLLEGGNAGAIVATSLNVYPIGMSVDEVGKYVQNLFDQWSNEDSKKPEK